MKLFLVRHGETEWNKLGKFLGQMDIGLNQRGLSQAQDTAKAAISWRATALYSSPLGRTMQVATEISKMVGVKVTTDPRLKELDLGEVEGVSGQQMREQWPQVYDDWQHHPELVAMPGGESLATLQERTWQAFLDLEGNQRETDNIVVVSHNFAIRAICGKMLGMPLSHFHRMYLNLASVTILDRTQMGWRLLGYNSTCHLSSQNQPD